MFDGGDTIDRSGRESGEPPCRSLIVGVHPRPIPLGTASSPAAAPAVPPALAPAADETARLHRDLEAARARHAAEVAHLRGELLDARKQACLGELLGTTTHEFNNALTTILNYARLGLRHRDQATRDKALERILSAGTRAAKITASILSMSRSRSTRFEPVDLLLLIEDVLVLLEREMMKYRVQVEREFAPVPRVSANPSQLQQVSLKGYSWTTWFRRYYLAHRLSKRQLPVSK